MAFHFPGSYRNAVSWSESRSSSSVSGSCCWELPFAGTPLCIRKYFTFDVAIESGQILVEVGLIAMSVILPTVVLLTLLDSDCARKLGWTCRRLSCLGFA